MKQTTFEHKYAVGARVMHFDQERTVTGVMAVVHAMGIMTLGYQLDHDARYVMQSDLSPIPFDPNDLVRIGSTQGNAVWSRKDVPDIPDDELILVCAAADRKDIKP